ncbi:secretion protein [Burkholderia sp. SCN-KJ]|nr:secretion protein [Burkholderia sp. SCN-KJ]MCR4468335.1 secretion protein [Burkholderia sp. SCN-KJ]
MKLLRILTGHHAGAQVHLDAGAYRIGADDDADVQLTDWQGADVLLVVEPNGTVSCERLDGSTAGVVDAADIASSVDQPTPPADSGNEAATGAAPADSVDEPAAGASPAGDGDGAAEPGLQDTQDATADPGKVWMVDFVPMQFDDTVICVGWVDGAWPSDIALLSTLLTGPADAKRDADDAERDAARIKRQRYAWITAACAAVTVGVIAISVALTTGTSRAAQTPPDLLLAQQVNRALSDAHLTELHAVRNGTTGRNGAGRAVVTGMVRSSGEDYIARQLFERMKPGVIERRYQVADDTARGIRDAIGVDGVQVTYDGQGVFTVSGAVADKQRVENALNRVRGDFDKNVQQIRVALTDASPSGSLPQQGTFTALVSSGDVQYAETPDGVKHIYAAPDAVAPASEAAAASATPATTTAASSIAVAASPVPLPSDDGVAARRPH